MSDNRYLWDRSGEPDPEIERLENLLRPFAGPGTAFRQSKPQPKPRRRFTWLPLALAAGLALAAFGLRWRSVSPAAESWETSANSRLAVGQWLDAARDIEVKVASIGRVNVAAGSRLRIDSSKEGDYRLRLDHGKLDAFILAPPRQFAVVTPAALAVDLGCAYSLEVDRAGESKVTVRSGWVAFEQNGHEAFIPAGAMCRASQRFGLGVPLYSDAPAEWRAAVARFEETRELALPAKATAREALTLWHLLPRVDSTRRAQVFDQLAAVITVPPGVSRDRALAGDRQAIETLWAGLGLGDAAFWRRWQRTLQ